ncbi:hypothetical protein [Cupriavidus sp. UGS-1]|uniref:hypothetical protein n=1 Tax=Cupriavidus sp. UGS-1 TaxID=2899826 RepID=UPI001E2EBDC5|nr:hypothetical protein [Cupriavidus sp. UGS-1]MCD9121114.1 hypothetical protein [Cupriavidus sp. UGS-1]
MNPRIGAALAAIGISLGTLPGAVIAHDATPAQYGGIVQTASELQFELVEKDGRVSLHVDDHGRKKAVAGASGKLTVLDGASKSETALQPARDNVLVAADKIVLARGAKAVAKVTFADGKIVTVRFVVK